MMMVGPKAHRGAHQAGHAGALSGMKLDEVARAAADLEGVLDNHVTLVRVGARDHLVDQRARQRRLTGAGPACDDDVPTVVDCFAQNLRVGRRKNPLANVIVERVEHLRGLAHHAAGLARNRRQQSFEPDSADRQFAFDDRIAGVGERPERRRDRADEPFGLNGRHVDLCRTHSVTVRLEGHLGRDYPIAVGIIERALDGLLRF